MRFVPTIIFETASHGARVNDMLDPNGSSCAYVKEKKKPSSHFYSRDFSIGHGLLLN